MARPLLLPPRLLVPLLSLLLLLHSSLLRTVSSYTLGECPTYSSRDTVADATTNLCPCKDGWAGPECRICQNTGACGSLKAGRMNCDRSSAVVNAVDGFCRVATDSVSRFLKGQGYITVHFERSGDATLEFLKQDMTTLAWSSVFACKGHNCRQIRDTITGDVQTSCSGGASCQATCEIGGPDKVCTQSVADIIKQVGQKNFALRCSANTTNCIIHEDLVDLYFKGITLDQCTFGECAPFGMSSNIVSGTIKEYKVNERQQHMYKQGSYVVAAFFGVLMLVVITVALALYHYLSDYHSYDKCVAMVAGLPMVDEELGKRKQSTTLAFRNVGYKLKGRGILHKVTGMAPAGEILAIMGPSGSGKSTLMDILSMKNKSGRVQGEIYVNGTPVTSQFKRDIGFVDQHDFLLPTMTVMESLMFSAMLRLPRSLTLKEKVRRVLNVMNELQITHIADSRVGNELKRGISGGEKRRVSVGMELVTQPRALFLDEPTSGLDTYNADLLVEILMELAQKNGTAVIMTIHQPRQNIFARFDRLLLICKGESVFYGPARQVHPYFKSIGRPIPEQYNPADYLIDILFTYACDDKELAPVVESADGVVIVDTASVTELIRRKSSIHKLPVAMDEENSMMEMGEAILPQAKPQPAEVELTGSRAGSSCNSTLAEVFAASDYAKNARDGVEAEIRRAGGPVGADTVDEHTGRGRLLIRRGGSSLRQIMDSRVNEADRIMWVAEVAVVSQRMFKDMLRKPSLVTTHVGAFTYFGVFLGVLYYHLSLSGIAAVQNRMGIFMLECVFLGFTSVSALPLFWLERPLYMHERSNRYYGTLSYFVSKIFSDMIPLRVIPPLLLAATTHLLVQLRPHWSHFFHYALVLILISVTAASLNLIIGMLTSGIMSGILVATILIIHFLVLTNIFINFETMAIGALRGLRFVSFFNYGYEALVINELAGQKIHNFPISEGSTVLTTLGFNVEHLYFNLFVLCFYAMGALSVAYLMLRFFVKEKR